MAESQVAEDISVLSSIATAVFRYISMAISELKRALAKGGNLLFVVSLGQCCIMFNTHRKYSYVQILECFSDLALMGFSLITDSKLEGRLLSMPAKHWRTSKVTNVAVSGSENDFLRYVHDYPDDPLLIRENIP